MSTYLCQVCVKACKGTLGNPLQFFKKLCLPFGFGWSDMMRIVTEHHVHGPQMGDGLTCGMRVFHLLLPGNHCVKMFEH